MPAVRRQTLYMTLYYTLSQRRGSAPHPAGRSHQCSRPGPGPISVHAPTTNRPHQSCIACRSPAVDTCSQPLGVHSRSSQVGHCGNTCSLKRKRVDLSGQSFRRRHSDARSRSSPGSPPSINVNLHKPDALIADAASRVYEVVGTAADSSRCERPKWECRNLPTATRPYHCMPILYHRGVLPRTHYHRAGLREMIISSVQFSPQ